ncbi:hypothetical protein [uncultured Robinsoniella sp.]|uniref:hypothetical protein n=1 Tax=uncultured Robinsoniella sp. TaxID=904190 RepID=UPI00374EDAC8
MSKYYYRTEVRFSADKSLHRKIADSIHKRDREKYKSVNDYILAAIEAFGESVELGVNLDRMEEIVRNAVKDEIQKATKYKIASEIDKEGGDNKSSMVLPDAAKNFLKEIGEY